MAASLAIWASCSDASTESAVPDTSTSNDDTTTDIDQPGPDVETPTDTADTPDTTPAPEDAVGEDVPVDVSSEETTASEDIPQPEDVPAPEDLLPPDDAPLPDDVPLPDDIPLPEDAGPSCVTFTEEVTPASAALLFVLDASASMSQGGKWAAAQSAIVQAIDEPTFDAMSLGLLVFPSTFVDPPQCICDHFQVDYPTCKSAIGGVSCGAPLLPQVAVGVAGPEKSSAETGIRKAIYDWLVGNGPLSNSDDGSPVYDALRAGYATLGAVNVERRVLVLITDGGFSCTSMATPPRDGYADFYGCLDWEKPDLVNALISASQTHPERPIETFIVGVPGSNSTGQKVGGYDTPPYPMSLALSTYAVSGSPKHLPPGCSSDAVFAPGNPEPTVPCHIDLSNGEGFNSAALAESILDIQREALGCVYDLPASPDGGVLDPSLINVDVTIDGATTAVLKQSSEGDACTDHLCWAFTPTGQIALIGKACEDVSAAAAAKVSIAYGCLSVPTL